MNTQYKRALNPYFLSKLILLINSKGALDKILYVKCLNFAARSLKMPFFRPVLRPRSAVINATVVEAVVMEVMAGVTEVMAILNAI